jgi:von Willebrand factor type A domain/Aerotolerance regulator N-terminal
MPSRPFRPLTFLARAWFPLSLIALFLLAIPGFILFALHMLGQAGDVNKWLQDNYQLTYNIPFAWWGALILLLLPLAILLLYFLKLKRKPLSVPSTFLWRKSIEDLHVNSLLQWLRNNLLLLLQLLTVLALIYGIMAFRFHGPTSEGKHYILMIDNSASMQSSDVQQNRLAWAKQEALKEIDAASDTDVGMVVVFNSSAEIVQSYTSNRAALRRAVEEIQPTNRPTRIEEALTLADSLANPGSSPDDSATRPPTQGIATELHLYSDGRFADVANFRLGNLTPRFHLAGQAGTESVDNVALVTCNARRSEEDPSRLQVLVRALNFRNTDVQTRVQLQVKVNGQLRDMPDQPLNLPARTATEDRESGQEPVIQHAPGEGSVSFELEVDDRSTVEIHARLMNLKDQFPLDDEAWLVVGVVRKARVLIVGNFNIFLDQFFDQDAVRDLAHVDRLSPDQLDKDTYLKPALKGEYDLVIFDRCGPRKVEDLPQANTFFIGYPPPPWEPVAGKEPEPPYVRPTEKLANPHIKGWMNKHPLLRYLSALHEIGIGEAFRMKDLPPRTPRLIESDHDTAVLLSLSREPYTDLVLTFPIITATGEPNTNMMVKGQFPVFLANVLYVLGNVRDAATEEVVQPGQVKTLRPDVAVTQIQVTDPAGKEHTLDRGKRADFSFGATDQLGVYQVAWNGAVQRSFAVNLLDPEESNIEPRPIVQIGDDRVAAGENRGQPRELWKAFVLAALGLLVAEWYIYNRRVSI